MATLHQLQALYNRRFKNRRGLPIGSAQQSYTGWHFIFPRAASRTSRTCDSAADPIFGPVYWSALLANNLVVFTMRTDPEPMDAACYRKADSNAVISAISYSLEMQ